jgi:hypothetical protein
MGKAALVFFAFNQMLLCRVKQLRLFVAFNQLLLCRSSSFKIKIAALRLHQQGACCS